MVALRDRRRRLREILFKSVWGLSELVSVRELELVLEELDEVLDVSEADLLCFARFLFLEPPLLLRFLRESDIAGN